MAMIRWFERFAFGIFERMLERKNFRWFLFVVFLVSVAAIGIAFLSKSCLNDYPSIKHVIEWLNRVDTGFAIIVGIITILSLFLALYGIIKFFERVTSFESLLEHAAGLYRDIRNDTLYIMGYYLTFGVITLGDTHEFAKSVDALEGASHQDRKVTANLLVLNPEARQEVLESYCRYKTTAQLTHTIRDKIEGTLAKSPFKDLYKQAVENYRNSDFDYPVAAYIFNVYNEHLVRSHAALERGCRYIGDRRDMPDFHLIFSSGLGKGIIFVPLRIPSAVEEEAKASARAEIIGWETADKNLIRRFEDIFKNYYDGAETKDTEKVRKELINTLQLVKNKLKQS